MASFEDTILNPVLEGTLRAPLDDFCLICPQGEVNLQAEISSDSHGDGFLLEVRDSQGRRIDQLFPLQRRLTASDWLPTANAKLAGEFPVVFPRVWPPHRWSDPFGGVVSASAHIRLHDMEVPAQGIDQLSRDEIEARIREKRSRDANGPPPSEGRTKGPHLHEHTAILRNTRLPFMNQGPEVITSHPFFGKNISQTTDSWMGDVQGGKLCLRQQGSHVGIHFRLESSEDREAEDGVFDAIVHSVGFMLAVNPWPVFRSLRIDHKLVERKLHLVTTVPQGRFVPVTKMVAQQDPHVVPSLLCALAAKFSGTDAHSARALRHFAWVFRAADNEDLPLAVQILLVCTVIEGLQALLKGELPRDRDPAFDVRNRVLEWCDEASRSSDGTQQGFFNGLAAYVKNWRGRSRREEWQSVFAPLFPANPDWLCDIYDLFEGIRHKLAHGAYASSDETVTLDCISRLAGFVNCVFAAYCGYKGILVNDLYSDGTINIG